MKKTLVLLLVFAILAICAVPALAQPDEGEIECVATNCGELPEGCATAADGFTVSTCLLGFSDGNDDTEFRAGPVFAYDGTEILRDFYTMPAGGGSATMLIGAYIELAPGAADDPCIQHLLCSTECFSGGLNEALDFYRENGFDWRLRALQRVKILLFDRDDPTVVGFQFDGTGEELAALPGANVWFNGPQAMLISFDMDVPAAAANGTWWQGRVDVWANEALHSHDDTVLIVGGLRNWMSGHGGTW